MQKLDQIWLMRFEALYIVCFYLDNQKTNKQANSGREETEIIKSHELCFLHKTIVTNVLKISRKIEQLMPSRSGWWSRQET